MTKAEYLRLLAVAQKNPQLNLVLQTICGTGIRVSELKYFTVESVRQGQIVVSCKNKTRTIFVPSKLKKLLLNYAKQKNIRAGEIFVGRNGKPLDRSRAQQHLAADEGPVPRCGRKRNEGVSS